MNVKCCASTGHTSQNGKTCGKLEGTTCPRQMPLWGDSLANLSVWQGKEGARTTLVTSGRKCAVLLAKCDPVGLLLRMLLASSIPTWIRWPMIWKPWATPSGRLLFRLRPLVRPTSESGCSLLPTPTAQDSTGRAYQYYRRADGSRGVTLTLAGVARMYPTPRASDAHGGRIYRQPPSRNGSPALKEITPGPLNPAWVEWLMGFPIGWTELKPSAMPSSHKSPNS